MSTLKNKNIKLNTNVELLRCLVKADYDVVEIELFINFGVTDYTAGKNNWITSSANLVNYIYIELDNGDCVQLGQSYDLYDILLDESKTKLFYDEVLDTYLRKLI
jgi:hypothetical protein